MSSELPTNAVAFSPLPWWRSTAGLVLIAALLSSGAAWWLIAWPVLAVANAAKHEGHFGLVYAHAIGGTIMLFFGAINLYIGSTNRHFNYHKLFGRIYLIGGMLGVSVVVIVL